MMRACARVTRGARDARRDRPPTAIATATPRARDRASERASAAAAAAREPVVRGGDGNGDDARDARRWRGMCVSDAWRA